MLMGTPFFFFVVISLQGTAMLNEKLGALPALGKIEYALSLSRENGFQLSISAPDLQNSKIELSKGVGRE